MHLILASNPISSEHITSPLWTDCYLIFGTYGLGLCPSTKEYKLFCHNGRTTPLLRMVRFVMLSIHLMRETEVMTLKTNLPRLHYDYELAVLGGRISIIDINARDLSINVWMLVEDMNQSFSQKKISGKRDAELDCLQTCVG